MQPHVPARAPSSRVKHAGEQEALSEAAKATERLSLQVKILNERGSMVMRGALKAVGVLVVATAIAVGGSYSYIHNVAAATGPNTLEIFDWWTAPGEKEAMTAMFSVFKQKYPLVKIVENPVAGGGGVSQRVVLQARLSAGLPPDTWQTLGGAELKAYYDGGHLAPLDQLYSQLNYLSAIPKPLAATVTFDGHPYAIPLNMHIQNILYYNKKLFAGLNLTPPTTYDELLKVAKAIKAANPKMYPLALGTKEKWEAAFVLDGLLFELGGPNYYVKLYKGGIDVKTDPTFRAALQRLQGLIPYIYPYNAGLTWDASAGLVVSGDAAMVSMGTWCIGYFKGRGWTPGKEFGAVTFPQKPERYLLFHSDTYILPKKAQHPAVTMDWLKVVSTPDLQIPTDVIQGGLFARLDIPPSKFPDPIRQELASYVRANPGKLILDQHGSIAPESFTQAYWDVIAAFIAKPDVDATISHVADLFQTYKVSTEAAWYRWP